MNAQATTGTKMLAVHTVVTYKDACVALAKHHPRVALRSEPDTVSTFATQATGEFPSIETEGDALSSLPS